MALINCPDCNLQVSDLANQCPKCAYPISSLRNQQLESESRSHRKIVSLNVKSPKFNQLPFIAKKKSILQAFILIILFGPFGLLYTSTKKTVLVVIALVVALILLTFIEVSEEQVRFISSLIGFAFLVGIYAIGINGVIEYNRLLQYKLSALNLPTFILIKDKFSGIHTKVSLNELVVDDNYQMDLQNLHNLISVENKKILGGRIDELSALMEKLCLTKEDGIILLIAYMNYVGRDLIKDLADLNSSYAEIRRNLSKFIALNIVEENYPHALKA